MKLLSVALLTVLLVPASASAQVEIAEPRYVPGTLDAIGGDAEHFYSFARDRMVRLDRDGSVDDPDGVRLKLQSYPQRVATGAGIVVVETGNPGSQLTGFTPDGDWLWEITLPAGRYPRALVFDGSTFVQLWKAFLDGEYRAGWTRIDPAGAIVDSKIVPGVRGPESAAARVGDGVLLAMGGDELALVYLHADGHMSGPHTIPIPVSGQPSIASDGEQAVVLWPSFDNRVSRGSLKGVRITRHLRIVDGPITVANHSVEKCDAAWDGVVFRLAWESTTRDSVETADVARDLEVEPGPTLFRGVRGSLHIVAGAGSVVFVRENMGVFAEAGAPLEADNTVRTLRPTRAWLTYPAIAWTGDRYAVAWTEEHAAVRVRFFARDGTPLGPSFATGASGRVAYGAIVATRDTILVMWNRYQTQDSTTYGQRFDLNGAPVDAEPFAMDDPSVATDGTDFTIAVFPEKCKIGLFSLGARAAFRPDVSATLSLCDESQQDLDGIGRVRLRWDGSEYGLLFHLLFRTHCYFECMDREVPYLMRISPSGASTAALPLVKQAPAGRTLSLTALDLVPVRGKYLVPWLSYGFENENGILVPFELGRWDLMTGPPSGLKIGALWTGDSLLLLTEFGYDVVDGDGHLRERVDGLLHVQAGASDGQGAAMIIHEAAGSYRLVGTIVGPGPERRRAVRK